jgi:hypothetical protein
VRMDAATSIKGATGHSAGDVLSQSKTSGRRSSGSKSTSMAADYSALPVHSSQSERPNQYQAYGRVFISGESIRRLGRSLPPWTPASPFTLLKILSRMVTRASM